MQNKEYMVIEQNVVWLRPISCEHVPLGYIGACNQSILPLTCPKGLASRRSTTWRMAFCTGIIYGLPIKSAFDGLMIQQHAHVVCNVLFQILISPVIFVQKSLRYSYLSGSQCLK